MTLLNGLNELCWKFHQDYLLIYHRDMPWSIKQDVTLWPYVETNALLGKRWEVAGCNTYLNCCSFYAPYFIYVNLEIKHNTRTPYLTVFTPDCQGFLSIHVFYRRIESRKFFYLYLFYVWSLGHSSKCGPSAWIDNRSEHIFLCSLYFVLK